MRKNYTFDGTLDESAAVDSHVFSRISNRVEVKAIPIFLDEESSPEAHKYVWAYHIQITNNRTHAVKLLNRVWNITDGSGHTHQIRGEGVIGEQPLIEPQSMFEYTSAVPLNTPTGFMSGLYEMVDEDGNEFAVNVPSFSLDSPHVPYTLQ